MTGLPIDCPTRSASARSAGVERLAARYRDAGLRDLSIDRYPGGRHEMLNETNRGEVRERLLGWISAALDKGGVTDPA